MGFFDRFVGKFSKKNLGKFVQRAHTAIGRAQVAKSSADILENTTISQRTREELNLMIGNSSQLSGGSLLKSAGSISELFGQAKEGTLAKFKTRQATQQLFNTMVDKPDSQRLRGGILNFGSSVRK